MITPVLILFFNRKETVLELIKRLSIVKPKFIYLGCDGARNYQEMILVQEIREAVLSEINWECDVHTNFNTHNLGCKLAVDNAVQWFFSQVNEGVVLEDDCIPSPVFFDYVTKCLETYRDNKQVATIGGRRESFASTNGDITFSSKFFCWGWASWSDRISPVDVEFGYQPFLPSSVTQGLSFWESRHVKGIHSLMLDGIVNSWAYSYDLAFRFYGQVHVVPPRNFISNIGIGQGTHDTGARKDSVKVIDEAFNAEVPTIINVNRCYMDEYFKSTYGLCKTLLFPYASKIKKIQKKWEYSK